MRLLQTYETTVLHPDKELLWQFLIVPARSISDIDTVNVPAVIQKLGLTRESSIKPSLLPFLMAEMLLSEPLAALLPRAEKLGQTWMQGRDSVSDESREALEFAEQVAFRRLLPFEHSPLSQESLASIITAAYDGGDNSSAALVNSSGTRLLIAGHYGGIVISAPNQWLLASPNVLERILDWLRGK